MPKSAVLKTMALTEILEQYPQTMPVLEQFGLYQYAKTETAKYENLQASALVHAIDLEKLTMALANVIGE